jgi:hypothetical protein
MGNTKNGGGATIELDKNGVCKAYNPHSANENCFDAPLKEMEARFGPEASCGHAAAFGQCNAGKTIKKMCCASCGGARPDAAKMNGGNGASGNKDVLRKELIADPTPQNKATPSKIPPAQAGCNDLPDLEFKTFYHALKETHWHAFKHEKSCPHAMMQGECADFRIREKCCASCTADDKSICVDKPASEVSAALGLSGVSCGTLAQAGRCDHADVKKNCCARCRKQQYYPQCKDMSEQELRSIVGAVEGEGGCPHAAALGKCEKSSFYHKACCNACTLHRDIMQ